MGTPDTAILAFKNIELDTARGELRRDGAVVGVEPQVFDLIVYLTRHPGEILSRDDLIEAVWGGRIVSDSAISTRISAARTALGDNGTAQRIIKTIPRRGFRFEALPRASSAPNPAQLEKPSIAVLPFQNMSRDPDQAYFSDGITDDIITGLSRYADLFVIARHSSFAYRDSTTSPTDIARELGVQYIAEGSVRRAGNRIRVTASLIDPQSGTQIWAERYDREITDIFEVQDEITGVIVNTLTGQIARLHHKRALAKSAEAVNAYDHVLRAFYHIWKFDPDGHRKAIDEAEAALAIDPANARAFAAISWAYLHFYTNAFSDDRGADGQKCASAARAAVAADDLDPWAHTALAWVYQWLDRAHDRALAELDRAVSLNPGSAYYRSLRAFSMTYAGHSAAALSELDASMRLNPHYPTVYHLFYGRALFNLHRYAEAIPHLELVCAAQPHHPNALALAAACYAANGQTDKAQATAAEVERANPKFTVTFAEATLPYARDDERTHFVTMLRRAGLAD